MNKGGLERMDRYVYKRYAFLVDVAGTSYSKKFDLDKNIRLVKGLLISSDKPNLLFYRGTQRIEISGDELYPEDYDSRLLLSGISVPPDQRYTELGNGVLSGNGEVKILYKDYNHTMIPFEPYQVILALKCEIK